MHSLIETKDGSYTILSKNFGEHYHSLNGALTESMHIFINYGLKKINKSNIRILELGLGTGLNAALSLIYSEKKKVYYTAYELYPPSKKQIDQFYNSFDDEIKRAGFDIFNSEWENEINLNSNFSIKKIKNDFTKANFHGKYDLVFFDAFSPETHPEAWSIDVFSKLYNVLVSGGIMVTYSSKGSVKRALRNTGFVVTRLEGPPGKRHVLKAEKY